MMATATTIFNDKLWFAFAEPSRRKLIDELLGKGEATASNLAEFVPISRQAISKHLIVLRKAGLVRSRRVGKEVRYLVQPAGLSEAVKEMGEASILWDEKLIKIKLIAEAINQQSVD